ncbi:MAG: ATP-NAD kinase family protein [Methanomicrobiales archaeon]|nr:ATP-NAD kinase family protein [Methanomicrobiales archaeon]
MVIFTPSGTIGFLINPIAGMGGKVGLKGTDGQYEEALRRGAEPQAGQRAASALSPLKDTPLLFLTCEGSMGEDVLRACGIDRYQVVYHHSGQSSAEDTKNACREFCQREVFLILFCGGDGTARDVYSIVRDRIPILGIPAGVKMYSAVFGVNPAACAEIVQNLDRAVLRDSEVVDVDEEAYRRGELSTTIYGYARVPSLPLRAQGGKQEFTAPDEEGAKKDIAFFITELMQEDTLYILGAGTTTEEIARRLGIEKTLLGVDVVMGGTVLARDADETAIISLLDRAGKAKIIVSPIGAQGFILGRGTQAISPAVVRRVGVENVIVVATPHKLAETPVLYLDSGDESLDRLFGDSILVISSYRLGVRRTLLHPSLASGKSPKD